MTPKTIALLILLIPALAISYYFAFALPASQRATLEFEKQKYESEKVEKEKREAETALAATTHKIKFEGCVREAEEDYWVYVKLNGKPSPGKAGAYTAPMSVWDTADKRKIDAVAECHRLYDK